MSKKHAEQMTTMMWVGVIALVLAAAGLAIAIAALVIAASKPKTAAPAWVCETPTLSVQGVCDTDVSPTIGAQLCKSGPMVTINVPYFTCDGTVNTSLGAGPLYIKLPVAYRTDANYGDLTVPSKFSGVVHGGDHPWLGDVVTFYNNGTLLDSQTYIEEISGVPYIVMGYATSGAEALTGFTPLGQFGPWYGLQFNYRARTTNGAGALGVSLGALAVAGAAALLAP